MFNIASKYFSIFDNIQIYILLSLIEEYVNGAELQIRRIDRTRNIIRKSVKDFQNTSWTIHRNRHQRIFCDAHFYFICIGQISKCLERLCRELNNKKLHRVNSIFNKEFSREIRNDLEHIDSRAVGKKKKGRKEIDIGIVQDFKNFIGEYLSFNGKRYPVNKESLNKLKSIYKELIKIINEEYAFKDINFVNRVRTEKYIEKITIAVQKEYQEYIKSKKLT